MSKPNIEKPLSDQELPFYGVGITDLSVDLSPEEVAASESKANGRHKRQMENNGFKLLCGCLGALVLIWIVDTIVQWLGGPTSEQLGSLFELGKTIVTFLLGYLFTADKKSS